MSVHKLDTQMYVGQKAFIKKGRKVLVLRDPDYAVNGNKGLDFPGGKYRWGKDLKNELQREVSEETSLKIKIGHPFTTWIADNFVQGTKTFLVGYICEYISGEVKLSEEHDDFEWVDIKTFKKWREKTDYYKALEKYFKLKSRALSSAG